jgi:hypothetical protein
MRILLVFLFLSGILNSLNAQQIKRFDDSFGLKGEVRYSGSWLDTILPSRGNFEFTWRDLNDNDIRTYRSTGRLNNSLPEGKWIWEEANWKFTIESGKALLPTFNSAGERKGWDGSFNKGLPTGIWTFSIDSLKQSEVTGNDGLVVKAEFKAGQVVGNISIKDNRPGKSFVMTGKCDANGIATGVWRSEQLDSTGNVIRKEERFYHQGVLVKFLSPDVKKPLIDSLSGLEAAIKKADSVWNGIPFEIGKHIFYADGYQSQLNQLADYYLFELIHGGWQHEVFNYSFNRIGPGYKQIYFPFTETEKTAIAVLDSLSKVIAAEVKTRLSNRKITLSRARNAQFDLAVDYAQKASLRVMAIDSLLKITNDEMFGYRNRFDAGILGWKTALSEPEVATALYFEESSEELPVPDFGKQKFEVFKEIDATLKVLQQNLQIHLHIIDSTNALLTKEAELQVLEEIIEVKQLTADSVYADSEGLTAHIASIWLDEYMNEAMRKYAQTDDFTLARQQANVMINQLDTLIKWRNSWPEIDAMYANLRERYIHRLYNPYTGKHDIEMRVKRRFFTHFEQELLPYMMGGLVEISNWHVWVEHVNFCFDTYSDMLDFALIDDRSSRKLEQRFRKEKNPERLARLLSAYMDSHKIAD